jgi:hypothetical protein
LCEGCTIYCVIVRFDVFTAVTRKNAVRDVAPCRSCVYTEDGILYSVIVFIATVVLSMSWDSAVRIAPGYRLDDRGVRIRVPVRSRIFSSPRRPDLFRGAPNTYPVGTEGSFHEGKYAGA